MTQVNSALSPYQYRPLDPTTNSIRLLSLQQDPWTGDLSFSLVHSRTHVKDYFALSYEWGPEGEEEEILIEGQTLQVRKNLAAFLRIAPKLYIGKKFWIDAICIDQSTEAVGERNHQVQQMGRIYSDATIVIVWLGLDFVSGIGHCDHRIRWFSTDRADRHNSCQLGELLIHGETILGTHSYFNRLWIIQEILLARQVELLIGTFSISWSEFWEGWWKLQDQREADEERRDAECPELRGIGSQFDYFRSPLRSHRKTRDKLHSLQHLKPRGLDIYELLDTYRSAGCSDRRDFIYAFLWLTPLGRTFKVDYQEDALHLVARAYKHFGATRTTAYRVKLLKMLFGVLMPGSGVPFCQEYLSNLKFSSLQRQESQWTLECECHPLFKIESRRQGKRSKYGKERTVSEQTAEASIIEQAVKLDGNGRGTNDKRSLEITVAAKIEHGMASIKTVISCDRKMLATLVSQMIAEKGKIDFHLKWNWGWTSISNRDVESYWRCETRQSSPDGQLEKVKVWESSH